VRDAREGRAGPAPVREAGRPLGWPDAGFPEASQTLIHLQTAYAQITGPVLAGLASRAPSPQTKRRYAHHLQQAVPEHTERILDDPAWDALVTVLAEAEAAGHNPTVILDRALSQRTLDDAHSPARALTWRVRRLGERHAPGPRAQAANASHAAAHTAAPRPQRPQARRR
jgi:hypothetical protein